MEILARAQALEAAGRDVVHLEVGEPDFPTPAAVVEAGREALRQGWTRYSPAEGLAGLRTAISDDYRAVHGVSVDPDRIVVTAGASAALSIAMQLIGDPGQRLLVPSPGYPCNPKFAAAAGLVVEPLAVGVGDRFQPTLSRVRDAWSADTCGLLQATPSNPHGCRANPETLEAQLAFAGAQGGWLVVDEIYGRIVHDGAPSTILERASPRMPLIVVNSFSKYFAMSGWRLGWMVVPEFAIDAARRWAQNLLIAPSTVAQHAAMRVLASDVRTMLDARVGELSKRRRLLLDGLSQVGLKPLVEPDGAFYIACALPGDAGSGEGSESWCRRLLESTGVALTPGTDFDPVDGGRWVRLAYAEPEGRLRDALRRIAGFR